MSLPIECFYQWGVDQFLDTHSMAAARATCTRLHKELPTRRMLERHMGVPCEGDVFARYREMYTMASSRVSWAQVSGSSASPPPHCGGRRGGDSLPRPVYGE